MKKNINLKEKNINKRKKRGGRINPFEDGFKF